MIRCFFRNTVDPIYYILTLGQRGVKVLEGRLNAKLVTSSKVKKKNKSFLSHTIYILTGNVKNWLS